MLYAHWVLGDTSLCSDRSAYRHNRPGPDDRSDVGRPGLRTQRGPRTTSQEGPSLCVGQKSNVTWEGMRAEVIEDTKRERERERERALEQLETDGLGDSRKEEDRESPLCLGSGVFTEDVAWCVSS